MVLSLYWIIRWILFSDSVSKKSEGVRLFRKVILIVMWLCLMAAMVINLIISFIGMDTEKKVYANGLICMSTSDGYNTDEYYNIKVGPFLRRNLTFKETIKFGLINDDDSTGDSGNDAGDSGACQLQGCSQPGMPVLFAMVTLPKAHFMLFSKPARLMEIRMRIG